MATRLPSPVLDGLIDDAAVFPPGLAPLPRAVSEHVARTAYRWAVGPLLVPAAAAREVRDLAGDSSVRLGLIARPGAPIDPVRAGVQTLANSRVHVVGVEVGAGSDWESLLDLGVPVTVEIPREGFEQALDRVAGVARHATGDQSLQAKFRTGATPNWAWPDEGELARFFVECLARKTSFKLTGGLHHAVRDDYPGPDGGPQHGLLNVLVGLDAAQQGATVGQVAEVLGIRHAQPLAEILLALSCDRVRRMRQAFTAYGCCTVLDPLRELAALDLIDKEHE